MNQEEKNLLFLDLVRGDNADANIARLVKAALTKEATDVSKNPMTRCTPEYKLGFAEGVLHLYALLRDQARHNSTLDN